MLSTGAPHYCFPAITQPMARLYLIFSHFEVYFTKNINNFIFQIFTFNGLGDTLYYYIVQSTVLIGLICLNFIIYQSIF